MFLLNFRAFSLLASHLFIITSGVELCVNLTFFKRNVVEPAFSRVMLMRKVHGQQLATLMLSASEYFVLDLMVQNMESRQMEMVSICICVCVFCNCICVFCVAAFVLQQ